MALLNSFPFPFSDPIAAPKRTDEYKYSDRDPEEGKCTKPWVDAFTAITGNMEKLPGRVGQISLTDQNASVAAVAIIPGDKSAGLYRISTSLRISTPDSLGSSLEIDFDWTTRGAIVGWHGDPFNANDKSKELSQTRLIRVDSLAELRYATVWTMTTGDGLYDIDIVVEEINA